MKHFIGGASVGYVFALIGIQKPKPCTSMTDLEFCVFIFAHALCAVLFGLAAWGLLP